MQNSNLPKDMCSAIGSASHNLQVYYMSGHVGLHTHKESWLEREAGHSCRCFCVRMKAGLATEPGRGKYFYINISVFLVLFKICL